MTTSLKLLRKTSRSLLTFICISLLEKNNHMLKAAIFDLNGIFLQSPKLSERFEKDFGVPVTTFLPKLSVIMDEARKPGAGNSFKFWAPALKEWGVKLSEQEFWGYWFKAEKVSDRMVSFAKELRSKGIKVFILSN